jgi:hypothetical protein
VFYVVLSAIVLTCFFVRLPELRNSFLRGITAPSDFAQDYIGARQLLSGKSVYPSNFDEMNRNLLQSFGSNLNPNIKFRNAHPPFVALLLFPFSLLSFHNAIILYMLITILSILFIIFLSLKSENISLIYYPFLVLFIFSWPPFQVNLYLGQISIFITLFVTLGWFFYKKGNENIAGFFIALATMIKFYPGFLLLFFLINKKYKALLSSLICMGIIFILTLIVTKYDFIHFIFDVIPKDVTYWGSNIENLSINGFFSKLFLPMRTYNNATALTVFVSPFLKNMLLYTTEGLLLFYAALHIRKYNNDLGFSLFIILSLLLSPLCWNYYFTLLILSFVILIKELIKRNDHYGMIFLGASLLLISIYAFSVNFRKAVYTAHLYLLGNHSSFIDTLTFYSLQFYGMVILLYLNFRLIKKAAQANMESRI